MTTERTICASHYDAVTREYPDADMSRLERGRKCGRCVFCTGRPAEEKPAPTLDVATLRALADEFDRMRAYAEKHVHLSQDPTRARTRIAMYRQFAQRYRHRATRVERERGQ